MSEGEDNLPTLAQLRPMLVPYTHSDLKEAVSQLLTSLLPYFTLWVLMVFSLKISYWLTLALALIAAGFLVRIFIIFHDCGHNSFFASAKANKMVGFWLGVLIFTPGEQWWKSHALHHATSGNLEKRGVGDVDTKTVAEFQQSPWLKRLFYWVYRFPPFTFGIGPIFSFLLVPRLPIPKYGKKETNSVIFTDLALAVVITMMSLLIGWKAFVMIQLPVIWMAGMMGIWLFYIQHQFQGVYWARSDRWNYLASALRGASFYKLPRLLKWFSGNIGFHHIHHLSPRIPSYYLDRCFSASPLLQEVVTTIDLRKSLDSLFLNLYDEQNQRMVGFHQLRSLG